MKLRVGVILAAAMLVVSASPGFAQGEVSGGIKVGVNFADLDFSEGGEDEEDEFQKRKTGFVVGGFVDVPVNERFSFQPELLYTQKGTKFEGEEDFGEGPVSFEQQIQIDQIQIPLLGKATFPGMQVRPFVVFGPAVGITTRAKVKSEFDGEEEEDDDIKDIVKAVEVSLVVGGGVQFGAGSVEIRYDHGLTNLSDDEDDDDFEIKSRTFSILLGWSF